MEGFDVVVRVAQLALESSGEGVETLERYVERAASAYRIEVDAVVLPEQMVLTERATLTTRRLAVVRAAPGIFRLDQVAALKRVLTDIEDGLGPDEACRRLDSIRASRPPWPTWWRVVGVAMFAAGFAPSVVASWGEVAASAVLGLVMGVLVVASAGRPWEGLLPFVGAFVVTILGVTVLSGLAERTGVTLMVLPALFITVPGDTLSAAAGELLSGRISAGAARLLYAFFVLAMIVLGIVAAAGVTGHADSLSETMPGADLSLAVVLAGWVVFSLGLVLAFNADLVLLGWVMPSVIATFLLQQSATRVVGAVLGTLVAGIALGAFANVTSAPRSRPPRLLLFLGGFFVLTVGGVGVRGVTALFGGDQISGVQDLADFALQVPTVALAVAVGVVATQHWHHQHART